MFGPSAVRKPARERRGAGGLAVSLSDERGGASLKLLFRIRPSLTRQPSPLRDDVILIINICARQIRLKEDTCPLMGHTWLLRGGLPLGWEGKTFLHLSVSVEIFHVMFAPVINMVRFIT